MLGHVSSHSTSSPVRWRTISNRPLARSSSATVIVAACSSVSGTTSIATMTGRPSAFHRRTVRSAGAAVSTWSSAASRGRPGRRPSRAAPSPRRTWLRGGRRRIRPVRRSAPPARRRPDWRSCSLPADGGSSRRARAAPAPRAAPGGRHPARRRAPVRSATTDRPMPRHAPFAQALAEGDPAAGAVIGPLLPRPDGSRPAPTGWDRTKIGLSPVFACRLRIVMGSPVDEAERLRRHGVRVTAQRLAVLRAVSERPHSTADDIDRVVRAEIGARRSSSATSPQRGPR